MKSIKVKSEIENLHKIIDFVNKQTQTDDVNLQLIIEEIYVNIAKYSNSDYVTINVEQDSNKNLVLLEFIDNGIPFNPVEKEKPELPDSIENAEIGGLGIHLIKNLSDSMKYYYNGKNHFIITKKVKK